MTKTALQFACAMAVIAAGCSFVVNADRSMVKDNLFQPSPVPDAAREGGDAGAADVMEDTGAIEEAGEAGAVEEAGEAGDAPVGEDASDATDAADSGG
jgi:hypothetical protein